MAQKQAERTRRARIALEGLSVGDAFGENFFRVQRPIVDLWDQNWLPPGIWPYTDDTEMALSIVEVLEAHQQIDQDALMAAFARRYTPGRGYGAGMHLLLRNVQAGADWRHATGQLFDGQGSFGNGAAMRIAPLGAFFADDIDQAIAQARAAASVTHAHPEGIAGAIAVAVATAWACHIGQGKAPSRMTLLDMVAEFVPDSAVREGIEAARELSPGIPALWAVKTLGNGSRISAQDTVPYCLWCASSSINNYEIALWTTISGHGDIDTNAAIVGGIVASAVGVEGIPAAWRAQREPLPLP